MNKQVMVYEIKSLAASNAKLLLSDDKKYFYWNRRVFRFLDIDDYVFVVDRYNHTLIFGKLDTNDIQVSTDNQTTVFNDLGKLFTVNGVWDNFIRIEILEFIKLPIDWEWQTLGSSENTYLNGKRISLDNTTNRIKNIKQLLGLSTDSIYEDVLKKSLLNFSTIQPQSTEIDKPLSESSLVNSPPDLDNDRKLIYQLVDQILDWKTLSIYTHEGNIEYSLSNNQEDLVYMILDRARNTVKIGFTSRELQKRINEHKTSNPHIELYHVFPNTQYTEGDLHKMFDDLHDSGEWFFLGKKLKDFVESEKSKHKSILNSYKIKLELNQLETIMLQNFN